MPRYHTDEFCQESLIYDLFTESPVPVSGLADDVIVMTVRASSSGQAATCDAKFAYMDTVVGNVGARVIKKAFIGSGKLTPIYAHNASHGLDHGYRNSWFGFLEDSIEEALRQRSPGQMITVLMLTPDRFARPRYFNQYRPSTWGLTSTDYRQLDVWLTSRFGKQRQRVRCLTCFAGTPEQCRGFQTSIGMRHTGKHNGRPKGSQNKKPRVPTLTPKQKTAFRRMLHSEIPYLVSELKLNGTQCYRYFKTIYGNIPVIRETVCRWAAKERGTPGRPGRPVTRRKTSAAMKAVKEESTVVEKECVILHCFYKRPSGTHPALLRIKRMRDAVKPLTHERDNKNVSIFLYSRVRQREIDVPP
jgi:hypothetical protein